MKYWLQRPESAVDLEPTRDALAVYLRVHSSLITITRYQYNRRLACDTYRVHLDGMQAGLTDGPVIYTMQGMTGCRECGSIALFGTTTHHGEPDVPLIRCRKCPYYTFRIPAEIKLYLGLPP
jgi:hypothetical protein